jgi:hypothetical protein
MSYAYPPLLQSTGLNKYLLSPVEQVDSPYRIKPCSHAPRHSRLSRHRPALDRIPLRPNHEGNPDTAQFQSSSEVEIRARPGGSQRFAIAG